MRLLFTAPRYHTNQHFAVKALLDAGHSVSFLALRRGQSETYAALEPQVLGPSAALDALRRLAARLPGARLSGSGGLPSPVKLWREMRRRPPAAVVVRDPFSGYGLLAALLTKLMGAGLLLYSQTPKHGPRVWWKRAVLKLYPKLMGAEWITPVLGSPLGSRAADSGLRYVPFVMEPQTAPHQRRRCGGGAVHLLAVGKYEPRKNHRLFLDAVHRLSRLYPVRATVAGECVTEEHRRELDGIRAHIRRLGLERLVQLHVNLPYAEAQRLYAGHDLFVLASRDEPAAVSPLEAMAHSLPVVCSDSNGTQCYIRPGENGFVFRSGDLDDLAACLARIVSDGERRRAMGERSYQLVLSEHSPQRYVESLMAAIGGDAR